LVWDTVTLPAYQTYVSENVFVPARVSGPTLYHEPVDALTYNFPVSLFAQSTRLALAQGRPFTSAPSSAYICVDLRLVFIRVYSRPFAVGDSFPAFPALTAFPRTGMKLALLSEVRQNVG
jgi:hypothetical protein